MKGYYTTALAAGRLLQVYESAPPRVRQYLEAEIDHVLRHLKPDDVVLELGCGYGRVLAPLASRAAVVLGIDTSSESLLLGRRMLSRFPNIHFLRMDAERLAFRMNTFDLVLCIQNGISAFHADQKKLLRESVRVTRPGGTVLFSSYSEKFWDDRLDWFRLQAEAGLLGEIDFEKTGHGLIVCRDGFTATTVDENRFLTLAGRLDVGVTTTEIDESSLFFKMIPY